MGISKKLETIYHNGQPDGIRSIRRSLSTMTTYVIPRPLLSEAKNITGINRHGIYYLINESEDNRIRANLHRSNAQRHFAAGRPQSLERFLEQSHHVFGGEQDLYAGYDQRA